jgi:hypothetical protein
MTTSIKELAGPVAEPTAEEAAWAALCVFRYVPGWDDRNELLGMLGLDDVRTGRVLDLATRRAVPDGFRRGRTGRKQ